MTRLRGWAPKGERLVDKVPCEGQVEDRDVPAPPCATTASTRPACLTDPSTASGFSRAYVDQFLVPTLKPGDVVILDNLGSHKGKAVRREAIRDVGARLVFLPKYSPDLQPHRAGLRKVQDRAPKGRGAKLRSHLPSLRRNPRPISARRMRRIPQKRRIRVDPKAGRSRGDFGVRICAVEGALKSNIGIYSLFIFRIRCV